MESPLSWFLHLKEFQEMGLKEIDGPKHLIATVFYFYFVFCIVRNNKEFAVVVLKIVF